MFCVIWSCHRSASTSGNKTACRKGCERTQRHILCKFCTCMCVLFFSFVFSAIWCCKAGETESISKCCLSMSTDVSDLWVTFHWWHEEEHLSFGMQMFCFETSVQERAKRLQHKQINLQAVTFTHFYAPRKLIKSQKNSGSTQSRTASQRRIY